MKSSKEILASIQEKDAAVQAIEAVVKEDGRKPTDEEQAAINNWYGVDDDHPGELDKLQAELATAQRREKKQAEIAAAARQKLQPTLDAHVAQQPGAQPKIKFRSRLGANSPFAKYYKDREEADYQAYVSGQKILGMLGNTRSDQWLKDHGHGDYRADMSEGTNSAGGFLVPDPVENVLITIAEENGVARRFCSVHTMTSDTLSIPVRTAGLTTYWPAENTAITESDLTLGNVSLVANKLATLTSISAELAEDAVVDVANELAVNIGIAFATEEDTQAFLGTGSPFTGLDASLSAGNSEYTAAAGNISWATLDLADFEATAALLPRFPGAMPRWYIHSAGYFNAMVRLMNANGGTPGSEIASGYAPTFLGYPVTFTQVLPSAPGVSTTVAFFGDLRQSLYMGIRRGVSIAADSGGKYFEAAQIAIRGMERIAFDVENLDGSAAGPVVCLTTPGA